MVACLFGLYAQVSNDTWVTIALLAGVGFFGASFPMVMAHGRAFLPPHLTGRGVSLINLFGIGGAGLMQIITGQSMYSYAWQPLPPLRRRLLSTTRITDAPMSMDGPMFMVRDEHGTVRLVPEFTGEM